MPSRFTHAQLVDKALLLLREVAHHCSQSGSAVEPSRGLRLALALLYTGGDPRPFYEFWTLATERPEREPEVLAIAFGRFQRLRSCIAAISKVNGVDYY